MKDLTTAVKEPIASPQFKADAKKSPRLRIYAARIDKGTLGSGGIVNLLTEYGYDIAALDSTETAKRDFAEPVEV
jgi:hypothetical protein